MGHPPSARAKRITWPVAHQVPNLMIPREKVEFVRKSFALLFRKLGADCEIS